MFRCRKIKGYPWKTAAWQHILLYNNLNIVSFDIYLFNVSVNNNNKVNVSPAYDRKKIVYNIEWVCLLSNWEDHAPDQTVEEGIERCDGVASDGMDPANIQARCPSSFLPRMAEIMYTPQVKFFQVIHITSSINLFVMCYFMKLTFRSC